MRTMIALALVLLTTSTAWTQTPRPPGWMPVPPGGQVLPKLAAAPVLAQSYDSLPVPADDFKPAVSAQPVMGKIVVQLPPNARLVVNGDPSKQVGSTRNFNAVEGEHEFVAEVNYGNSVYRSTKRVASVPGSTIAINFSELDRYSYGYSQPSQIYSSSYGDSCSTGH